MRKIAKSNQEVVENTLSIPQETLEFRMNFKKNLFYSIFLSN